MRIIAGLGNPGKKYENTRHNLGFRVIDELSKKLGIEIDRNKFSANYGEGRVNGEKVVLLKPATFMNESGRAIREAADFYKVLPEDILVIYDDFDIDTGAVRIRKSGSAGTHNGMRSVLGQMGTSDIPRIRVGTGSSDMEGKDVIGFVLGGFSDEEKDKVDEAVKKAAEAAAFSLDNDMDLVMNRFNCK